MEKRIETELIGPYKECPKCGEVAGVNDKVCLGCGYDLRKFRVI